MLHITVFSGICDFFVALNHKIRDFFFFSILLILNIIQINIVLKKIGNILSDFDANI